MAENLHQWVFLMNLRHKKRTGLLCACGSFLFLKLCRDLQRSIKIYPQGTHAQTTTARAVVGGRGGNCGKMWHKDKIKKITSRSC
jgi:hypothetical protein